jgi:hyaluronan synthase
MNKHTKLKLIYYAFITLTLLAIFPPIFYFLGYEGVWNVYAKIYFLCIFIYIWYRFTHLAYDEFKKDVWGANLYSPFTVIVPCYNEDPELLKQAVESVEDATGDKKIIIIDDGSDNNVLDTIKELMNKYDNIKALKFSKNRGKRKALYEAFKRIDTEFIVTIDSDTLIEKNAFVYLIAPFADKKIGATTGNIRLTNEKRNILTRIIAGMYMSGIDNYKKAQSVRGNVICCSGCLSAYRTEIIAPLAKDFLEQKFFGKPATHSEDRHLTNLVLEKGFKVIYVEKSLCYTETPHTLRKFLKQQQRWKRGFVRETIYLLSHSWKTSKSLFFEALVGNALPFFLGFGIQFFIVFMLFLDPMQVLKFILPAWFVFMTIRELPMFIDHPIRSFWFYFYIPVYEIFLWWQNLIAVFTVNNTGWLTR